MTDEEKEIAKEALKERFSNRKMIKVTFENITDVGSGPKVFFFEKNGLLQSLSYEGDANVFTCKTVDAKDGKETIVINELKTL